MVQKADTLMSETGLCLVWVPDADIVIKLVEAADRGDRDAILELNSDRILGSIEAAIEEVVHPQLRALRDTTAEAAQAARSGFFGASQTLSATVLTGILEDHYGFSFGLARQAFDAEPTCRRWALVTSPSSGPTSHSTLDRSVRGTAGKASIGTSLATALTSDTFPRSIHLKL